MKNWLKNFLAFLGLAADTKPPRGKNASPLYDL